MGKRIASVSVRTVAIELQKSSASGDVLLVVSIPGREGTVTHMYRGGVGTGVTAPQAEDIKATVMRLLDDWLLTVEGLQGVLPTM